MRLPYNLFVCERCDLAGESEVAQQVASVWRDFDIENRVARKEIGKRRADLCFGCQDQKSGRIVADAELDWAAKHSFRFDTAEFAFSNLSSARQLRARQRKRNFVANLVIGRATNDLAFRSAAIIDFRSEERRVGKQCCVRRVCG